MGQPLKCPFQNDLQKCPVENVPVAEHDDTDSPYTVYGVSGEFLGLHLE